MDDDALDQVIFSKYIATARYLIGRSKRTNQDGVGMWCYFSSLLLSLFSGNCGIAEQQFGSTV
jgi:hypothetical protein